MYFEVTVAAYIISLTTDSKNNIPNKTMANLNIYKIFLSCMDLWGFVLDNDRKLKKVTLGALKLSDG